MGPSQKNANTPSPLSCFFVLLNTNIKTNVRLIMMGSSAIAIRVQGECTLQIDLRRVCRLNEKRDVQVFREYVGACANGLAVSGPLPFHTKEWSRALSTH